MRAKSEKDNEIRESLNSLGAWMFKFSIKVSSFIPRISINHSLFNNNNGTSSATPKPAFHVSVPFRYFQNAFVYIYLPLDARPEYDEL